MPRLKTFRATILPSLESIARKTKPVALRRSALLFDRARFVELQRALGWEVPLRLPPGILLLSPVERAGFRLPDVAPYSLCK
jgi:hypothetical protein